MAAKVRIPTPLRGLASGKDLLEIEGGSLRICIDTLESAYPGFKERICDEAGGVRRFVKIYVNGGDVRFLDGISPAIKAGDEISIVPAVAGG